LSTNAGLIKVRKTKKVAIWKSLAQFGRLVHLLTKWKILWLCLPI